MYASHYPVVRMILQYSYWRDSPKRLARHDMNLGEKLKVKILLADFSPVSHGGVAKTGSKKMLAAAGCAEIAFLDVSGK